ncbi:hypothetical protein BCR39DRAFT_588343 [Naematelia encephala]|uniref:Uncharacterized protein n=1 Tax=Naematelia encephala TaxID=71784 RepID=A0A1Y2B394_9TREE|nr:hypothetical protein BCR39DRAFT_588343 [Naematelia encephala]
MSESEGPGTEAEPLGSGFGLTTVTGATGATGAMGSMREGARTRGGTTLPTSAGMAETPEMSLPTHSSGHTSSVHRDSLITGLSTWIFSSLNAERIFRASVIAGGAYTGFRFASSGDSPFDYIAGTIKGGAAGDVLRRGVEHAYRSFMRGGQIQSSADRTAGQTIRGSAVPGSIV